MSIADQLLEERRRRRRAGDPRLSEAGRDILLRMTTGDLAEQFGHCGLRGGELRGLRRRDVDLLHKSIAVTRQLQDIRGGGFDIPR